MRLFDSAAQSSRKGETRVAPIDPARVLRLPVTLGNLLAWQLATAIEGMGSLNRF